MLSSILQHLDRLYDLELDLDIHDFLVDAQTCTRLGHSSARASVLVHERHSHDELELGVYIGEAELEQLSKIDLTAQIHPESFELLVTAIEEVSHFAYLSFCASREKRVTQLELELQAEVDKFITATLLVASRNRGRVPSGFLDRLFGDFEIRADVDAGSHERYAAAASFASRYCSYVVQDSLGGASLRALLPELRSFYRLTQGGKIGRIHNVIYTA
jgi:hypothetical protein